MAYYWPDYGITMYLLIGEKFLLHAGFVPTILYFIIFHWWFFDMLITLILRVWCIIISVIYFVIVVGNPYTEFSVNVDIRKNGNKFKVINELKLDLKNICETDIIPQD